MIEKARFEKALKIILHSEGRTCHDFEDCGHLSCESSHWAWIIADAALNGGKHWDEIIHAYEHHEPDSLGG